MGRAATMLLAVTFPLLSGCFGESAPDASWKVFLDELPAGLDAAYGQEVREALEAWAGASDLELRYVPTSGPSDLMVQYIRDWGGSMLGQHYAGLAQIGVGDSDCGRWQPYTLGTVRTIALHEIGHALGHDHSEDPASIMYERAAVDYAYHFDERVNMPPAYVRLFSVCAAADNATYRFEVEADGPLNMYLVPDRAQYEAIRQGVEFTHYPSCSKENARALSGTCTIATLGGLVLENEHRNEDVDGRVTITRVE